MAWPICTERASISPRASPSARAACRRWPSRKAAPPARSVWLRVLRCPDTACRAPPVVFIGPQPLLDFALGRLLSWPRSAASAGILLQQCIEAVYCVVSWLCTDAMRTSKSLICSVRRLAGLLQAVDVGRHRPQGRISDLQHLLAGATVPSPDVRLKKCLDVGVVAAQGLAEIRAVDVERAVVLHLDAHRLQVDVLSRPRSPCRHHAQQAALQRTQHAVARQHPFIAAGARSCTGR